MIFIPKSLAQETTSLGFSYYNILPDNQIEIANYFDLLVEPNHKQELETLLKNDSSEDMTIIISVNDATTTPRGVIEYGPSKSKNLDSLKYKMSDILTGPTEVFLKKGESQRVTFKLTLPEAKFSGVLLGGIQLEKQEKSVEQKSHTTVKNKYAYVFSVSLRQQTKRVPYELRSGGVPLGINKDSQKSS